MYTDKLERGCGVPQCIVLGPPFFFMIYLNNLFKSQDPEIIIRFADDTTLYR